MSALDVSSYRTLSYEEGDLGGVRHGPFENYAKPMNIPSQEEPTDCAAHLICFLDMASLSYFEQATNHQFDLHFPLALLMRFCTRH